MSRATKQRFIERQLRPSQAGSTSGQRESNINDPHPFTAAAAPAASISSGSFNEHNRKSARESWKLLPILCYFLFTAAWPRHIRNAHRAAGIGNADNTTHHSQRKEANLLCVCLYVCLENLFLKKMRWPGRQAARQPGRQAGQGHCRCYRYEEVVASMVCGEAGRCAQWRR